MIPAQLGSPATGLDCTSCNHYTTCTGKEAPPQAPRTASPSGVSPPSSTAPAARPSLSRREETAAPAEKALPATSRVKLGGVEYLRFLDSVDAGNLWAASYVNVDSLRVASEPFLIWQIIFTVFLILEILLFLYLIHRMIAKPMARFANEVSQLEEKGMLSSQERPGGDMDFLYRSFVDVSNRLKTSLEKEYRSKLMIYQSEIKFIQAQVRPHFL